MFCRKVASNRFGTCSATWAGAGSGVRPGSGSVLGHEAEAGSSAQGSVCGCAHLERHGPVGLLDGVLLGREVSVTHLRIISRAGRVRTLHMHAHVTCTCACACACACDMCMHVCMHMYMLCMHVCHVHVHVHVHVVGGLRHGRVGSMRGREVGNARRRQTCSRHPACRRTRRPGPSGPTPVWPWRTARSPRRAR